MEANIEMRLDNEPWERYDFIEEGQEFTIGRHDSNDIRIGLPSVSRHHGKILEKDGKFYFEDYSKFGTKVNNERIVQDKIEISHGDIIEFNNAELILKEFKNKSFQVHTIQDDTISDLSQQDSIGHYLEDIHGKSIPIDKNYFTLGSHEKNQLVIDNKLVSEHHCTIHIKDHAVFLENHGDFTLVNGVEVTFEPIFLPQKSIIQIGDSKYKYKSEIKDKEFSKFNIITKSKAMFDIIKDIEMFAETDEPVLITGNTGTGKELAAQAIHMASSRQSKNFVAINCSNLKGDVVDSELFGHIEGSFTGASKKKKGYFQLADEGTLFLDELGELPELTQAKLLRVLETGRVHPVGADEDVKVNVRIVTATNCLLHDSEYRSENFREDLFYRLNVLSLHLPDLKDRKEDIPLLMKYFSDLIKVKYPKLANKKFSNKAIQEAQKLDWDGNIRELQNACIRSLIRSRSNTIESIDDHFNISKKEVKKDFSEVDLKYHDLMKAISETYNKNGRVSDTDLSKRLNKSRPTIKKWRNDLHDFGIKEMDIINHYAAN